MFLFWELCPLSCLMCQCWQPLLTAVSFCKSTIFSWQIQVMSRYRQKLFALHFRDSAVDSCLPAVAIYPISSARGNLRCGQWYSSRGKLDEWGELLGEKCSLNHWLMLYGPVLPTTLVSSTRHSGLVASLVLTLITMLRKASSDLRWIPHWQKSWEAAFSKPNESFQPHVQVKFLSSAPMMLAGISWDADKHLKRI